jgi:hypothetical protein
MKRLRRFPGIAIPGLLVLFSYYLLFGTEGANGAERDKQERRFFSFLLSAPLSRRAGTVILLFLLLPLLLLTSKAKF